MLTGTVLEVPDENDPTTWTFQLMTSWALASATTDASQQQSHTTLGELKEKATVFAEPFRSANAWVPDGTPVHVNRLNYWVPQQRSSRAGRVTLAGDAGHPMTFHRGQGLNHAIGDAAKFVEMMKRAAGGEMALAEAVEEFDAESIKRGGGEVLFSKMNTEMVHDWERLMQSPVIQVGTTLST